MSESSIYAPETEGLVKYLGSEVLPDWKGCELESFDRVTGGLSWETYRVDVRETAGERRRRFAVKRAPTRGSLEPYDITKEASILRALGASDVPVPEVLSYTTETRHFVRPFSVMEFIEGESPDLRKVDEWPRWRDEEARSRVADEVIAALAAMHRFDWKAAALPALPRGDGGAEAVLGASIDHFFGNVVKYVLPDWPRQPMVRHVALWLKENVPSCAESDLVLVHGDFRFGNWMFQGERMAAVLDWERASLGDPMQDLGFLCMPLARRRYPHLMGLLLPIDELARRFEKATGVAVDLARLHYYMIYWNFVEGALVPRGISYATQFEDADEPELRSITAYPQLAITVTQLAQLIDDFEAGRHVL
jgi:aminoglycoside phosphotransferase (APT) family kinase protein